jgi:hypothetical protein
MRLSSKRLVGLRPSACMSSTKRKVVDLSEFRHRHIAETSMRHIADAYLEMQASRAKEMSAEEIEHSHRAV